MHRFALLMLVGCAVFYTTQAVGRPGGLSPVKDADETVRALVADVQPEIQQKLGKPVEGSDVISYKTQVVSGTVYFVKAKTGDGEFAHLKIYKTLGNVSSLKEVQKGKAAEDEIVYF